MTPPSVRATDVSVPSQVITDPLTGRSKGYGFVRFGNEAERDRSLTEMSGHIINSRPIRVSVATAKKSQNSVMVSTVLRGRLSALHCCIEDWGCTTHIGMLLCAEEDAYSWVYGISSHV